MLKGGRTMCVTGVLEVFADGMRDIIEAMETEVSAIRCTVPEDLECEDIMEVAGDYGYMITQTFRDGYVLESL